MSLMPVCELWTPNAEGTALERKEASYIGYESFRDASEGVTFPKGEGLPGQVWQTGLPQVWTALDAPAGFIRAQAAADAGLSAGLGYPIMAGQEVTAVMVFLFAQGPEPTGVMEVWTPDPGGALLGWHSGFYGQLEDIKAQSVTAKFEPGQGLPGKVWQDGVPMLFPSLWPTSDFVREEVAAVAGLKTGLGLPVWHDDKVVAVAALLSSDTMPFAKIFEIWLPDASGTALERGAGFYGRLGGFLSQEDQRAIFAKGSGLPGQVWESKTPRILSPLDEQSGFARYQAAQSAQLGVAIGIPVIAGNEVVAVVLLLD